MYNFISKSEKDTINFAKGLASKLHKGDIIVLTGELGSGKTKFTQGFLEYFGLENEISSPTFTIVNEYNSNTGLNIYHFDVYRLSDTDEFYAIGGDEYFENGKDSVQIYIRTNIGENESELVKIASGGEMSRIMLAIKTVLADTDEVPILIFDEIDTGISGKAAKSVGEKIKIISQKHQVLCITHQANIAAKGDSNYFISKKVENEKTYTNIKLLNEAEVIEEIARISSGDITKNALEHAREMRLSK